MAKDQFTKEGFLGLMREHVQEVARGSTFIDLGLEDMTKLGIMLHNKSAAGDRKDSAARGLQILFPQSAAPAPGTAETPPAPSNRTTTGW